MTIHLYLMTLSPSSTSNDFSSTATKLRSHMAYFLMLQELRKKYIRRRTWPETTATVSGVEFQFNGQRNSYGDFYVSYTFWIDGHIYGGAYTESAQGPQTPYYLKKDDPIDICYNREDPNLNFNPVVDMIYQHGFKAIIFGSALAIVLIALVVFFAMN
jgi:hypothetical protein